MYDSRYISIYFLPNSELKLLYIFSMDVFSAMHNNILVFDVHNYKTLHENQMPGISLSFSISISKNQLMCIIIKHFVRTKCQEYLPLSLFLFLNINFIILHDGHIVVQCDWLLHNAMKLAIANSTISYEMQDVTICSKLINTGFFDCFQPGGQLLLVLCTTFIKPLTACIC